MALELTFVQQLTHLPSEASRNHTFLKHKPQDAKMSWIKGFFVQACIVGRKFSFGYAFEKYHMDVFQSCPGRTLIWECCVLIWEDGSWLHEDFLCNDGAAHNDAALCWKHCCREIEWDFSVPNMHHDTGLMHAHVSTLLSAIILMHFWRALMFAKIWLCVTWGIVIVHVPMISISHSQYEHTALHAGHIWSAVEYRWRSFKLKEHASFLCSENRTCREACVFCTLWLRNIYCKFHAFSCEI